MNSTSLLGNMKDKFVEPSKQFAASYKEPFQKFVDTMKGNGEVRQEGDRFVNEDEVGVPLDSTGQPNPLATDPHLNTHRNRILDAAERSSWCGCRKRWQLAFLANVGFVIAFGIRCNLGAARNQMVSNFTSPSGVFHEPDFDWGEAELSLMEGSFFYGYIITQIPGGFLAAKFPPNKLFGLAIGLASFFNLLMPVSLSSGAFYVVVTQMLQGLVQGVSYPAMHGVWRYWAPPMERSKLATTAFTGSYAGAVIGIPLSSVAVAYLGWPAPFYVYGLAGIIWATFWFSLTFEKPANHPTISNEERVYIEQKLGHISHVTPTLRNIPWTAILSSKPVWAIVVANFARSWTFYLLLTHQLTYMKEVHDVEIRKGGFIAAVPHLLMAVVVLVGGQLADLLRSRGILSTTSVRKLFNCGGFGGEAVFLLLVAYAGNNSESAAVIGLTLAVGSSGFAISGYQVNHLDIAPRYAAILMGMSNGVGTFAGMICPFVTEHLKKEGKPGWETVWLLASLIHFTGITFYGVFASGELQDWAEPPPEQEPWKADDFAQKAVNAGYGATHQEPGGAKPPIPPPPTQQGSNYDQYDYRNQYFDPNSAWGSAPPPTGVVNDFYQGY